VLSTPIEGHDDLEELFRRDEYLAAVYIDKSRWLENPRRKGMNIADLGATPICISMGCSEIFRKCCERIGFTPHILSTNTTRYTALQWALSDAGVAVVPVESDDDLDAKYKIKKLLDADSELYKSVVRVKGRPLSPLALRFLEYYNENSNSRKLCSIRKLRKEGHF